MKRKRKTIVCSDGFKMSVQASQTNYCEPRNNVGPYVSVEVGFPSALDKDLLPYAEDRENPTKTVYGWVPSKVVMKVIAKRGGMVDGELPPMGY